MSTAVATLADFGERRMMAVKANGLNLVLFRLEDGGVAVLEDRCSHADVRLSRGEYEDGVVECPAHGARFEVNTGRHLCMPAVTGVRSFPATVIDGTIVVELP
jgi:3-phenylpropionate/trans-cinnamate dioxygenase ferredoxin subunit